VTDRRFIFGAVLNDKLGNTIIPLTSAGVNISIKLTGGDALGVQNVSLDFTVRARFVAFERDHSVLETGVIVGLAATRGSDEHESVTHLASVVKLDDLAVEDGHVDELEVLHRGFNSKGKLTIVIVGLSNTREEILNNVSEERQIVVQELGDIDIEKGSQEELVFVGLVSLSNQATSGVNSGTHSTHSVIVMALSRKLLGR